jgi:alkylation response protein AidB-like acyl-CoA dehydrogenase
VNLEFSAADERFRSEVREFLERKLPVSLSSKVLEGRPLEREDSLSWTRILHERGWSAPSWPTEFGGPGWSTLQQLIFDEECSRAGAPPILPFGVSMVAPVLMAFGSRSQQDYFLPRILSGEHWWCQGYSEPGAGSDLASLRTRAELRGDHYVVNGQKTWNTYGHLADWIFCLVRTNAQVRPQAGISFLLIDMKTPGITVRPIPLLDGGHEVNEIWFDNVAVPAANRVGTENEGWTYAKYLLTHERAGIAQLGQSKRELRNLKQLARRQELDGRPLSEDARFRERIAELEVDLLALEFTVLRMLQSGAHPGPESSVLKVRGSDLQQALSELKMQALGPDALAAIPEGLTARYFNLRKTSIYGGSNEIQRNIIAQRLLGL